MAGVWWQYGALLILTFNYVIVFAVNNSTHEVHEEEVYENCNRPWPKLSLFIPVGLKNGSSRNSEWSEVFLHSLTMFWPIALSNTSLVVMLDNEVKGSELQQTYVDKIINEGKNKTNFPQIDVKYHVPNITYQSGHDRQQHVMFYADQYTDAEYIGFGDSDCLFFANIDREDLFEDNKPVVHGRIGYLRKVQIPYSRWPASTYHFLQMEEPMICMSYFPVIIKAAHLKDLREYLESIHKSSFDTIFTAYGSGKSFSQFNIMCTFMWYKKNEEYKWYINDLTPWWNGIKPAPMYGQWSERYIFDKEMFSPKPFISTHVRYRSTASALVGNPENVNKLFVRGLCHTSPETNILKVNCTKYLSTVNHYEEMHKFEDADYNDRFNLTELRAMQLQRMRRFRGCDLSYGHPAMLNHFEKFNYTSLDYEHMLKGTASRRR